MPARPAAPEMVTVVAIDPKTGRQVGRTLLNADGNGSIDLGGFTGNFIVRVASGEAPSQRALEETDTDGDGIPDSRDNCINVRTPTSATAAATAMATPATPTSTTTASSTSTSPP